MAEFTLPWPPTVNHYYTVARGRKILSQKGRAYKKECGYFLKATDIKGAIRVEIACHMPDKRKRDLDNLLKPLLDALTDNGVFEDDSQIADLRIYKTDYGEKGTVVIKIREMESC